MFRIVMEKVGEIPMGYRVQRESYNSHYGGQYWAKQGRRFMTLEGARDFRKYLETIQADTRGQSYDIVEQ